jgi:hypothetical protein
MNEYCEAHGALLNPYCWACENYLADAPDTKKMTEEGRATELAQWLARPYLAPTELVMTRISRLVGRHVWYSEIVNDPDALIYEASHWEEFRATHSITQHLWHDDIAEFGIPQEWYSIIPVGVAMRGPAAVLAFMDEVMESEGR